MAVSVPARTGSALVWEGWRSRPVGWGFWLDGISVDRATFDRLRGVEMTSSTT
jgi:hypothetical protein